MFLKDKFKLDGMMALMQSTKDVDYFTQLIYEALRINERERQNKKIKENIDKIKLQGLSQRRNAPEGSRTIINFKS